MKIIIIDTETTGFQKDANVIDISALTIDNTFSVVSKFNRLIKNKTPIHPKATEIHKYTNSFIKKNGIDKEEAFSSFNEYLLNEKNTNGKIILVGHNILYDIRVILIDNKNQPIVETIEEHCIFIDTFSIFGKDKLINIAKTKLGLSDDDIVSEYGNPHSASADVEITARLIPEFMCSTMNIIKHKKEIDTKKYTL